LKRRAFSVRLDKSEALPAVDPKDYKGVFRAVMVGDDDRPGLLKQVDMSVVKLARIAAIKRPNIQAYLSGKRFPSPENAIKIARALGIPWESFRQMIVMRDRRSLFPKLTVFGEVREDKAKREYHRRASESMKEVAAGKASGMLDGVLLAPLTRPEQRGGRASEQKGAEVPDPEDQKMIRNLLRWADHAA
jgi:transcriptional regulator with XRE-family HTH domain